ncbi:10948_t:CDS:1, partial [Funneliformis mosseae]
SIYDKKTLLTFDESGKFYGSQLYSPYKDQNINSTYLCDKYALDATFNSNLISLKRAKK